MLVSLLFTDDRAIVYDTHIYNLCFVVNSWEKITSIMPGQKIFTLKLGYVYVWFEERK